MFDEELTAVFRDQNSHCALRVGEKDGLVHFIAIAEKDGSIVVDLFKLTAREFHHEYKEIANYPINKAAAHYLHPITTAIRVTDAAERQLNSILKIKEHRTMSTTNSANVAHTTVAAKNVAAAHKSSVKTSTKASDAPKVADVKSKTPTKAQQDAAKKATAAKAAAAKADEAKAKQVAKDEAAAKANAAKGKAPPAAIKKAKAAKKVAKAAKATKKPVPAKKVAKLVRNPKHEAPAKKGAKPAKAAKADKALKGSGRGFDETHHIKVLVDENPKRQGSAAYDIFELLKKSKTVGDFYKKGGGAHNLRYNIDHEFIKVVK